jgi:hypothetical protein
MPTILQLGPYRFFFYSDDFSEPAHIHVQRERFKAKFWLNPVRVQQSGGFSRNELSRIQNLVEEHEELFLRRWDEYFTT